MDNEIVNGKFFPALKHRDYDHAIPPGGTPPSVGGRAGSEVFLRYGSDISVGGLGSSRKGFLQISYHKSSTMNL